MAMDQWRTRSPIAIARRPLVSDAHELRTGARAWRACPVLAPYRWLRAADPLPHSWEVTSDSIAAWLAGELGARRVVLVKAPGATGELADAYFERTLRPALESRIVTADDGTSLAAALMLPK